MSRSVCGQLGELTWEDGETCDMREVAIVTCGWDCKDRQITRAAIAQLVARGSHNPKVVSSILTGRIRWYYPDVYC